MNPFLLRKEETQSVGRGDDLPFAPYESVLPFAPYESFGKSPKEGGREFSEGRGAGILRRKGGGKSPKEGGRARGYINLICEVSS